MSQQRVSGQFIAGTKGPIFVLLRKPPAHSRGCVLVVPPFAEEMNKARRMVTEAALQLAERGVAVLIPDLFGTGDSCGEFADATWKVWQGDVASTARWSAEQGLPVTGILGIRIGCALATEAVASGVLPSTARSVFWQPVFDGGRFLTQFLRLRLAANLMGDRKESLAELRSRLDSGETLEVAGYYLCGRLAADLASLVPPVLLPPGLGEVAWLEVGREAGHSLPLPSQSLIDRTRLQGGILHERMFAGEPFWTTSEIVVLPELVGATIAHLSAARLQSGR